LSQPASSSCLQALDVFILAGGLGTRLQSVLGGLPKLLAPIENRPYVAYLIDWLARFGARRIVFGLGHKAEAIIAYLNDHPRADLAIETVIEPRPLGTAGAIRFARAQLRSDPVLVLNGDSYVAADLCEFVKRHAAAGKQATLLCAEVDDAGRYGRTQLDSQGYIQKFLEKDAAFHGHSPVNAGVYLLSASLLDRIADSDAVSLERDIFERLPAGSLAGFASRAAFIDIGTPDSLAAAADIFRHASASNLAASR
jgi:NDP-sugar pyrophosphorylase family protein